MEENLYKIQYRVMQARYRGKTTCPVCKGSRLRPEALYVQVGYKKLKSVGASNLVFGILIILFGIGAGVMMIINGARLLAHRSDSLF